MECFTADFSQFKKLNAKIYFLGGQLGTRHQIPTFQGVF